MSDRISIQIDLILALIIFVMVILPKITNVPIDDPEMIAKQQTLFEMVLLFWLVGSFLPRVTKKLKLERVKELVTMLVPLLILVVFLTYIGTINPDTDTTMIKYLVYGYLVFIVIVKIVSKRWFVKKYGQQIDNGEKKDEDISDA